MEWWKLEAIWKRENPKVRVVLNTLLSPTVYKVQFTSKNPTDSTSPKLSKMSNVLQNPSFPEGERKERTYTQLVMKKTWQCMQQIQQTDQKTGFCSSGWIYLLLDILA